MMDQIEGKLRALVLQTLGMIWLLRRRCDDEEKFVKSSTGPSVNSSSNRPSSIALGMP